MQKPSPFIAKTQKSTVSDAPQVEELLKNLEFHKSIQNITNRINNAENIKEIILDFKEDIRNLFTLHVLNIYIIDKAKKEIYTMYIDGTTIKESRFPINNSTIAGYVANTKRMVHIADAYNERELKNINDQIKFDRTFDKQLNVLTGQVVAVPIIHERNIMGVLEAMNKKGGDKIDDYRQIFLDEIANVLGIAFYNQERFLKQRREFKFDYLIRHGLISETQMDKAMEEVRDNKERIESILMNKYNISKDNIGKALEDYHNCKFVTFDDKLPIPGDLLKNLKKPFLKRELWVPLSKSEGKINVIVDDPSDIIKKDTIEGLLKTKFVSGLCLQAYILCQFRYSGHSITQTVG